MKKIVIGMIVWVAAVVSVNAQTSQGTFSVGGSIAATATKDEESGEDTRTSSFSFVPSIGYFVVDKLMVGASFSLYNQKQDDGFGGDDKYKSFGVGPFARYYIFTANEKFAFTATAGLNFGFGKSIPDGAEETKATSFGIYLSPGFTYFLTEKWGLDLQFSGISYTSTDPDKDGDDDKTSTFQFGLSSFSPSLGVRYYFGN